MDDYIINEYITLKFENSETCIYIRKNNNFERLFSIQEISFDEPLQEDPKYLNPKLRKMPPESLFKEDCAMFKTWADKEYDGKFLHGNLAFPILEELYKSGDPIAKKVFKREIIKKYIESSYEVQELLEYYDYLKYISEVDLINALEPEENSAFFEIKELLREMGNIIYERAFRFDEEKVRRRDFSSQLFYTFGEGHIDGIELDLLNRKLEVFPRLSAFKGLKELKLYNVDGLKFFYPNLELKSVRLLTLHLNSPINIRKVYSIFPNLFSLDLFGYYPNFVSEKKESFPIDDLKADLKKNLKKLKYFNVYFNPKNHFQNINIDF